MSKKSTLADERFARFNCAQTVFSLFAEELGLDETTALKKNLTTELPYFLHNFFSAARFKKIK
jgi:hypothetical protein